MPTTRHDITVNQGSSFKLNVQALNADRMVMDLSGYEAKMQIREYPGSLIVLMEASTTNGLITINSPGGLIMVDVGADVTSLMTWNTGSYDLEIFNSLTNVIRVAAGFASLSAEVTV